MYFKGSHIPVKWQFFREFIISAGWRLAEVAAFWWASMMQTKKITSIFHYCHDSGEFYLPRDEKGGITSAERPFLTLCSPQTQFCHGFSSRLETGDSRAAGIVCTVTKMGWFPPSLPKFPSLFQWDPCPKEPTALKAGAGYSYLFLLQPLVLLSALSLRVYIYKFIL